VPSLAFGSFAALDRACVLWVRFRGRWAAHASGGGSEQHT